MTKFKVPCNREPMRAPMCGMATRQQGSSLIEVLVAILLISISLLAAVAAQTRAVAAGKSATYRLAASLLASAAAEMTRADSRAILGDDAPIGFTSHDDSSGQRACALPTCDPASGKVAEDFAWLVATARTALPQGDLVVLQDAGGGAQADVWVTWHEPPTLSASAEDDVALSGAASDGCHGVSVAPVPSGDGTLRCFYLRVGL